jgi:ABC-type transport system substrate-binding protein
MFIASLNAWEYNEETPSDNHSESFGPRVDRILIKLYNDHELMWNALREGQLDLTDYDLTNESYRIFCAPPFNNTINVISSSSDGAFYILDINNNNNKFLGNPPDQNYPNPVYPNPCSVLGMRKAIAYLCNRDYIVDNITGPLGYPLYTPLIPESGMYIHPEIHPGGAKEDLCYMYSRTMAIASLNSSGFAQKDSEGWRIWNLTGQRVELRFYIKFTDPKRKAFGDYLASELEAVGVKVQKVYWPIVSLNEDPQIFKNFHLSIDAWQGLGVEPDHLILWHWDYYWHPGRPYNLAGCNDAIYNEAVNNAMTTDSLENAAAAVHIAQERFAQMVLSVPLWCTYKCQAVSRRYVGTPSTPDPEDIWEGKFWEGMIPSSGMSCDENIVGNTFTLLNMRPENFVAGDGLHMTIRYGFSTSRLNSLNPIFAERSWDQKVLSLIYESLLKRDPYNLSNFIPWLAQSFGTGTYLHPTRGECTKIRITMRPNVYWSDGTPLTAADVFFSLKEMYEILNNRGIYPIWCPWMQYVEGFKMMDPYSFEILLNTKNIWAISWIGTSRILPKHIWEPLCKTADPSFLTGFAPDPDLIASGPWRLKEYIENSHIELVRNSAGRIIQTNLYGSVPITSPQGYFKTKPLEAKVYGENQLATFPALIYQSPARVNLTIELQNLWYKGNLTIDNYLYVDEVIQSYYPLTNLSLEPFSFFIQNFNQLWISGKHKIKVANYIESPDPWAGQWFNLTYYVWITTRADIAGSTFYDDIEFQWYPLKSQLPTPDMKVDIKDIATASKAFRTYLGHPFWNTVADINGDYKVDIRDIAVIACAFGWSAK